MFYNMLKVHCKLLKLQINTQPNPLEIYQVVYDQGISTMCAPFYKAWADELDNNNDFKAADRIYELGKRVKAQPVEMLEEAHLYVFNLDYNFYVG